MSIADWIPAIVGAAADVGGMLFSKHQADTAHQREVKDLQAAGLNPLLSVMGGRGAATGEVPSLGEDVHKGVSSALAMRAQRAELALMEQQRLKTAAETRASTMQTDLLQAQAPFLVASAQNQADRSESDSLAARLSLSFLAPKAHAEVLATTASARRANALASLEELMRTGAVNEQQLEQDLGEAGPAGRALLEVLRTLRKPR